MFKILNLLIFFGIVFGKQYTALNLISSNQKLINYTQPINPGIWLNRVVETQNDGSKVTKIIRSTFNQTLQTISHIPTIIANSQNSSHLILSAYDIYNATSFIIGNKQTNTYTFYLLNRGAGTSSSQELRLFPSISFETAQYSVISTPFNQTRMKLLLFNQLFINDAIYFYASIQDVSKIRKWRFLQSLPNITAYDNNDFSAIIANNTFYWREDRTINPNFQIPNISDYTTNVCSGYWALGDAVYQARTIVMGWKYSQSQKNYYYRVIITGTQQNLQYQTVVQQFNGTSTTKPIFYYDLNKCTKLVVSTTTSQNKSIYIIKSITITYGEKSVLDVNVPKQIAQKDVQFYVEQEFVYTIEKQTSTLGQIKGRVYLFNKNFLYPIFQQTIGILQYHSLNATRIQYQFPYIYYNVFMHLFIYRYYIFNDQFYFKKIIPLSKFEFNIQEDKFSSEMTTYLYEIINDINYTAASYKTKLIKASEPTNTWIYTYNNTKLLQSVFNIDLILYEKQFNETSDHTIRRHYQTTEIPLFVSFSKNLTSILFVYKTSSKIVKFNKQLKTFSQIIISAIGSSLASPKLVIASSGNAFLIDSSIYYSSTFDNYQKISSIEISDTRYGLSQNFDFLFYQSKLYEMVGQTYQQIVSSPSYSIPIEQNFTHLRSNFKVSSDKTKMIFISIFSTKNQPIYQKSLIIILCKKNSLWKLIYNSSKLVNITRETVSQNFQIFSYQLNGFEYLNTSSKMQLLYINYENQLVYALENSSYVKKYNFQQYPVDFTITNNFAFLQNHTHEVVYKINKPLSANQNLSLTQYKSNAHDASYANLSTYSNIISLTTMYQNSNLASLDIIYQIYNQTQQLGFTKYIKLLRNTINLVQSNNISSTNTNTSNTTNNSIIYTVYNPLQFYLQSQQRGYLIDYNNNFTIYLCPPACSVCFTTKVCRKCNDGYALNITSQICIKCMGSCKSCQTFEPSICFQCYSTYFLKNQLCRKCHPTCLECNYQGKFQCTKCRIGQSLLPISSQNQKVCLTCPTNCEICQNSAPNYTLTKCKNCSYGYGIDSKGSCQECLLNCNQCNGDNVTICQQCPDGYYNNKSINTQSNQINQSSEGVTCQKCLKNCQLCFSSTKCDECIQNYQLNLAKSQCILSCQFPCKQCSSKNSSQCLSCIEGYKLQKSNSTCQADVSCRSNVCKSCPLNYTLLNDKCEACMPKSKCASCSKGNFAQCLSCQKGSYLQSGECIDCPVQCQQCQNYFLCKKCADGYMLAQNGAASICISCDSNCKTCKFSTTNCLSCYDGDRLNGFECVAQNLISFSFTINYQLAQLTTIKIVEIKNDLANQIKKQSSQIYFNSIKSGSVLLEGGINSKSIDDQKSIVSSLNNLNTGAVIGGSEIIQSSFTASLISDTSQSSSINIGMLIGIIVGGLVVIVAIGCFIYNRAGQKLREKRRKKHSKKKQEEQDQGDHKRK